MKLCIICITAVCLSGCGLHYDYTTTKCGVTVPLTSRGDFAEGANSVWASQFTWVVTSAPNVTPPTVLFTAKDQTLCQFTAIGSTPQ